MHRNTWKAHERKVAGFFDTIRNPLSGGNSRVTRSDTRHPCLYIELKSGMGVPKTWAAIEALFRDTEEKATKEHKFPVVVLKPAGSASAIANWTGYIRVPDGSLNGAIVGAPLRVIKAMTTHLCEEKPVDTIPHWPLTPEESLHQKSW